MQAEKLRNPLTGRKVNVTLGTAQKIAAQLSELDVPLVWRMVIKRFEAEGRVFKYKDANTVKSVHNVPSNGSKQKLVTVQEESDRFAKWLAANDKYFVTLNKRYFTIERLAWKSADEDIGRIELVWSKKTTKQAMLAVTVDLGEGAKTYKLVADFAKWTYKAESNDLRGKAFLLGAIKFFEEKRKMEVLSRASAMMALDSICAKDVVNIETIGKDAVVLNKVIKKVAYEYLYEINGVRLWTAYDPRMYVTKYYIEDDGNGEHVKAWIDNIMKEYPPEGYGTNFRKIKSVKGHITYEGVVFNGSD